MKEYKWNSAVTYIGAEDISWDDRTRSVMPLEGERWAHEKCAEQAGSISGMMVSVMLFQVSWHKKRAAISLVMSGLWAFACWLLPLHSTAFVPLKAHIWICCLCRELTVQFFATITKRVFRGYVASRQKSFNIKNMSYLAIYISY